MQSDACANGTDQLKDDSGPNGNRQYTVTKFQNVIGSDQRHGESDIRLGQRCQTKSDGGVVCVDKAEARASTVAGDGSRMIRKVGNSWILDGFIARVANPQCFIVRLPIENNVIVFG